MSALAARIAAEHAAVAGGLPEHVLAATRRRAALERLVAEGLPGPRDENWRYAALRSLDKARFAPLPAAPGLAGDAQPLPPELPGFERLVFIDGRRGGAGIDGLRVGAEVDGPATGAAGSTVPAAATPDTPGRRRGDDRFALLNDVFAVDVARLELPAHTSRCVELVFVATRAAELGASYPRILIDLGPAARLTLVERHLCADDAGAALVNVRCDVALAREAQLQHYRLQDLGAKATWLDTLEAAVHADAGYELRVVTAGALASRSTTHITLAGERARTVIDWAAVADGAQVHDAHLEVAHVAADGRTEQTFRGIAGGRARVACNGKVVVGAAARGTDSRQSLRGLLGAAGAEIDVRPQLEIYTDDVRCSHGATAGKLDETMLFYLLARGIDRDTARHLLQWAFLEDVIARFDVAGLRRAVELRLAGRMQHADLIREVL